MADNMAHSAPSSGSAVMTPVFNVYTDHDLPDLADIFRQWLLDMHPPGAKYYPTTCAFPDLSMVASSPPAPTADEYSRTASRCY